MVSINTNLSSLIVQKSLTKSTNALNLAIERMTTGAKLNHASDNAANYSIVKDMSSKISSYEVAENNASMGLDLLSTASDSLDLVQNHLSRIRDLAEQASNGTYGTESLQTIQAEVDARTAEINRIISNTNYNDIQLFEGGTKLINPVTPLSEEEALAQGYKLIKTVEDLQNMDIYNSYILMNDIDMEGVNWTEKDLYYGIFNGNGYAIKNLNIYNNFISLNFHASAKNIVFENASIGHAYIFNTSVENTSVENCYFNLARSSYPAISSSTSLSVTNCIEVQPKYSSNYKNITFWDENGNRTEYTEDPEGWGRGYNNPADLPENAYNIIYGGSGGGGQFTFQVGINGDSSSQISINTAFNFNLSVDVSSHSSAVNALSRIDSIMSTISSKQTEIGAAQNRLESVLDSISTAYENLVSSRSTLQDADIATESSAYIRAQILQQASATLLATANQSPSVALQLL